MKNYFIAAHYNLNNGDRAVLEATVQQIISIDPEAHIVVSAFAPKLLKDERYITVGWPVRDGYVIKKIFYIMQKKSTYKLFKKCYSWFVDKKYLYALRHADVVLVSGGHHLTDILGLDTYNLLASNFLVPIYENKRVVLLPQSIGPVSDINAKKNLIYILNNVENIAYRDKSSKNFLNTLELKSIYSYVPDIVFSLPVKEVSLPRSKKTIGVALYCCYASPKKENLFPQIINNLTEALDKCMKDNYAVRFISMDINDLNVAESVIKALKTRGYTDVGIERPATKNVLDTIKLFADKDIIFAYKTHSVVFSLINSVSTIAIAYHPKSIEFMETIGLKEYAINDTEANSNKLMELVHEIEDNREQIIQTEKIGVKNNTRMIVEYMKSIM